MPHGKETKRHSNSCLIDYANASSQKWGKQRKQTMPGSLGDVGLCWRTNEGNLSHSIMKGRAKSQQKPIKSGKGPLCKILLLGNPTDGQKTFVDGVIDHGFTKSCGLDWTVKTISVRGQSIRLQFYHPICDSATLDHPITVALMDSSSSMISRIRNPLEMQLNGSKTLKNSQERTPLDC